MASHDLKDEAALVGVGGSSDGIHGLDDAVEGRVSADGHVSAAEVVVNGAHHADDVQVGVSLAFLLRDLTCRKPLLINSPVSSHYPFIYWRRG